MLIDIEETIAVKKHRKRLRKPSGPVLVGHHRSIGLEPCDIAHALAADLAALEPFPPAKHRMAVSEIDHTSRELQQALIRMLPIEPRKLVVLTVRVVVSVLGPALLVAQHEHWNPLRQEE